MTSVSTVRMFEYKKPIEENSEERVVYVINEDDDYIQGLDFKYLDKKERTRVQLLLAGHSVGTPKFGESQLDGLDEPWKQAFRCFRKDRIINE